MPLFKGKFSTLNALGAIYNVNKERKKKTSLGFTLTSIITIYCVQYRHFYAPPTIVEGHSVFWSVPPLFVHPSVRSSVFRLKFLVKVVFDEVEDQTNWNLVRMFPTWYDLSNFNAKLDFLPNFTVHWTWKMIVRVGHPCT